MGRGQRGRDDINANDKEDRSCLLREQEIAALPSH